MTSPEIYSGSSTLFKMAVPPTGWTKDTSYHNYTLRVVTGTGSAGSGGSLDFTTVFSSLSVSASATVAGAIGPTTLNSTHLPAHTHTFNSSSAAPGKYTAGTVNPLTVALGPSWDYPGSSSTDGGSAHTHPSGDIGFSWSSASTINLAVKYVDVIIATRN